MRQNIILGAFLALGVLCVGQAVLAGDDPVEHCQLQVAACGSKGQFDEEKCQKLAARIDECKAGTNPGTVCRLTLANITPTQTSVGRQAALCKSRKLEARAARTDFKDGLSRYLLKPDNLVPTVLGPAGAEGSGHRFYITDHHHLSYALLQAKLEMDKAVFACIIADKQDYDMEEFWDYLVRHHFVWLEDDQGRAITTTQLRQITAIDQLVDNPYRTWSAWVRTSCGYLKYGEDCLGDKPRKDDLAAANVENPPPYFMEFRWADYLAVNLPELRSLDFGNTSDAALRQNLTKALDLAQGKQAFIEDLPGFNDPDDPLFPLKPISFANGCEKED